MTPTDLTLKHYARVPGFKFDPTFDYSGKRRRDDKPAGLWVSVAGPYDWHEWCTAEEFSLDSLTNEHDVTLTPDAHILHIDNLADLEDLTYKYPAPTPEWRRSSVWADDPYPDWRRIGVEYDGIIIAPYQWSARWSLSWYYGWDCASGCIWNLSAVAAVTPARQAVTA